MEIKWQFVALAIILTLSSASAKGNCVVCDGTIEDCQNKPESITPTECDGNCFTKIESNGKYKRGCLKDTETCSEKNCKTCTAVDKPCNIKSDYFWCKVCDSSSNPDCAYWKNENSIPTEFCGTDVSTCVMEVNSDKHTSRHCATKNENVCESGKKCNGCTDGSGCNTGVFPKDRRKCYQCSSEGTDGAKCAAPSKNTDDIKSFPCLFFDESEKCFEHGSSDTAMSRGCLSDATAYGKCTAESPAEKCKVCETDNCNVDEYKVEASVKCIQCKADDTKCSGTHSVDDATKCGTKIEYWKDQGCYTNKVESGKIDRGCIQDFDCKSASTTCTSCLKSSGCNNGETSVGTERKCYKCRSDENAKCENPLENQSFESKPCRNENVGDYQCFIDKWNGIIMRSCLADADEKTRKNCLDSNYKDCEVCKEDNCNSGKPPNSAQSIALASGLIAFSFLVLRFL